MKGKLEIFLSHTIYIYRGKGISKFFLVGSYNEEKYEGSLKKYAPLCMGRRTWKNAGLPRGSGGCVTSCRGEGVAISRFRG